MSKSNSLSFNTRIIHHNYSPDSHLGSLIPPLYQSSTFTFSTVEKAGECFNGKEQGMFILE